MAHDEIHLPPAEDPTSSDEETVKGMRDSDHIVDILEEERQEHAAAPVTSHGPLANRYRELLCDQDDAPDSGSAEGLPRRVGSPIDSLLSVPDGTPSIQGSVLSSPGSSILPSVASRPGLNSPRPSFRPFDRRFSSRIASPSTLSPRPSSPAFLGGHSRTASLTSQLLLDPGDTDTPTPPWEVVRWTRLKKLNGQAFSEAGKRNFGAPTCIAVSASIVLGTSKGIILMFDYNQNLKMIIGPGTKAVESGPITSIAISADHTTVAGGHASGNIFTWDTNRASRPFLTIPHLESAQLQNRTVDGHAPDVAVTHLGFLGTRHTALVSADDKGMAFSHLATRGTGALGRTVKTVRILGRYPNAPTPVDKLLKPSTVLAFASLPLGNVDRATDGMGLTAMLTPYLLVIVSTTPVAQTQHKSARPKDVEPHSAMSGCLAWFPAVRLKVPDPNTGSTMSKVKLVYCWSNVLTVLDVDEIPTDDKDKPPTLRFKARSRWKCEEAIVAVQWLSRSVLTVLTISQRLIVLEDRTMRMTEAFDLIHKHIYHADLFSTQLHALVEQLDEEDTSMHGVVADAFYMSLKAYKGRLFLLGFNDVSIGALSNWADRLIALMENGDYVGAIQLATSYYTGDADKLTVGLPEDTELRHKMVHDKLVEIMSASLKYAFGQRQKNKASADDQHLQELAETCFVSCQSISDIDFVFDEMWEWYDDGDVEGIFLETLEPYILEQTIKMVPPTVVKAMVTHFVSKGWESRLEEIICHMETATLDIDEVTLLCKQHGLYDALIYVWNQALRDYVTPMIDLVTLLIPLMQNGDQDSGNLMNDEIYGVNALKMFPYLSYTLTGRVYPTGEVMDDETAAQAKAEIYWFLFSGQVVTWPKGSDKTFRTRPAQSQEPSFPYLRMILKFDAPSFLSALNEAFEDSFLNESQEKHLNGGSRKDIPEEQIFGLTVDRQYVVSILLEIMSPEDFAPEDTIYLDMFIARNLPKFPQYLILPGSTLIKIITGLCNYPGEDLADDAQLSTEYLLSVFEPPDLAPLIPLFKNAGFYRILKRIYRNDKQFGKLLQIYFEDPEDREEVFDCIGECLRSPDLTKRQIQEVQEVIKVHSRDLVELDAERAAQTLTKHAPELHEYVLESLSERSRLQYEYLKTLLEPEEVPAGGKTSLNRDFVEQYVQLMCKYRPSHVSDYVGFVQTTNLRLDKLLPTMEENGVIDAAVKLMAREGQVSDAMNRLIKHLETLESALQGLLVETNGHGEEVDLQQSAEHLLQGLQDYTHVGIWLCQGQMKMTKKLSALQRRQSSPTANDLTPDEKLWLDLIDATVQITRRLSTIVAPSGAGSKTVTNRQLDTEKLVALLRSLVQHTFTALLTATSAQSTSPTSSSRLASSSSGSSLTFLRILKAFLTQAAAASPNLADLRAVLASIFSAYAYEESILRLSSRMLEQQLFVNVQSAVQLRQRGWRPKGSTCEACGRRLWGPGVQGNVFEAWEEKQAIEDRKRAEKKAAKAAIGAPRERDKGKAATPIATPGGYFEAFGPDKGKEKNGGTNKGMTGSLTGAGNGEDDRAATAGENTNGNSRDQLLGPLVVLACRHVYHQNCLDLLQARKADTYRTVDDFGRELREYRCPIDG
ncbi:Golgi CORVET complex core vacuolar protein 8-domain-containing protein [Truncatella angustata]|uniref:Golgi CORVET complex core vacuolar protein 8-domain-containing protein n=1 Tax=Truncatella angustata TaxID=152316 RepID=A0A9P8UTP6_9PEZI|nr:Golgi CORVET complex core vacuolar protein 8-domain-containing protein [Truncatella angustata]KAH6657810.1 Golgi CORVET complex core vacuolar protein 8-domain-containing protein [Truncatella angustata]